MEFMSSRQEEEEETEEEEEEERVIQGVIGKRRCCIQYVSRGGYFDGSWGKL